MLVATILLDRAIIVCLAEALKVRSALKINVLSKQFHVVKNGSDKQAKEI
jgi:hypothetical protein